MKRVLALVLLCAACEPETIEPGSESSGGSSSEESSSEDSGTTDADSATSTTGPLTLCEQVIACVLEHYDEAQQRCIGVAECFDDDLSDGVDRDDVGGCGCFEANWRADCWPNACRN